MLDKECLVHISTVMDAANKVWGYLDWEITDIEIIDAPFGAFEMFVQIEDRYDIKFEYDRSIWAIAVKVNGNYVWLSDLTNKHVIELYNTNKEESLIHNFKILNQVLHSMENRT